MAKVDKLEQKYYELKSRKFNKEQNQNEKNAYRAKMGKLSAEEFSIKNDENINDEEKQKRLAEINEEKKLLENTKNNDISENLKAGFSKNEEAIDRILSLRDNAKKDIKKLEYNLKKEKEQIEKHKEVKELEARLEAGRGANSTMSNQEYVALVSELKEKRANLGEKPNVEKIEKQIASKRMMVTKCNLAWKCLFRNETWNDIHIKAVRINSQKKEKQAEIKSEGNNKEPKKSIAKEMEEWFFKEEDSEKNQEDRETIQKNGSSMVVYDEFAKKHPLLAKIRDAFKNRFGKKKENNTQNHEIEQQEKKRDSFIEELKSYAEKGNSQQNLNQKYAEKLEKTNSINEEVR